MTKTKYILMLTVEDNIAGSIKMTSPNTFVFFSENQNHRKQHSRNFLNLEQNFTSWEFT